MTNITETTVTTQTNLDGSSTSILQPYVYSPLDRYGGRKFILTTLIFIMTFIALGFNLVDKDVFKYITYAIIITYVGGNVIQKVGLNFIDTNSKITNP